MTTFNVAAFTFSEAEAKVTGLAVAATASLLASKEEDSAKRKRMNRILHEKLDLLASVGIELTGGSNPEALSAALAQSVTEWDEVKRNALLVELAFADPFAPYEIQVSERRREECLMHLTPALGLDPSRVTQLMESVRSARKVHRHMPWKRIAAGAIVGSVVVAIGGYALAPIIAAHLGAAAGLSGAAAVSHGLALLGGGSLAAGGSGVAGGMMLVAGAGATVGGVGAGGAAAVWSAGYAAAVAELVKLQVTYREILLRTQLRGMAAAELVETLLRQRDELRRKIAEEEELNDPGANRIKTLEQIERAYADAAKWMSEQTPTNVTIKQKSKLERAIHKTLGQADESELLDEELAKQLEARFVGSFSRSADLDRLDVVAVSCTGAIAAALDVLLVAVPKDIVYLGRHEQKGSILTKLFKSWIVPAENTLSERAKVPFDAVSGDRPVPGMSPGSHRFLTPGHDPILGFAVGVHDILRGGRSAIGTDGLWRFDEHTGIREEQLVGAIALEFLHLLSDVGTKLGLPAPFMTFAGFLRFGSFDEQDRTVADLARYMYLQGYDLRHFVTTLSASAAIRMLLGAYFTGRSYCDIRYRTHRDANARANQGALKHPTLETMVFLADAMACAANMGKIALYQGNPSAFSYGQWLALLRSSCKVTLNHMESPSDILIDRSRANEKVLEERWASLRTILKAERP